jgi:hypothetical protein
MRAAGLHYEGIGRGGAAETAEAVT